MSGLDVEAVVADPEWIPHTYDAGGGTLTFVHVPLAARDGLMFLSDDHYKGGYRKAAFPAGLVSASAASLPEAPLHFIFHTAFCCSTLLVKALGEAGGVGVLKEPDVLIHLANRLVQADDAANRQRLRLVLRLLARPAAAGGTVIVKPSNFANRLADAALDLLPGSRAILLFSELRPFLGSVAKRGLPGRIWGRQLYRSHVRWTPLRFGYEPAETFDQTDLQIAGLGWLMQIHHFSALARRYGPERILLLDGAGFLAAKAETLDRAGGFLGLGLDRTEAERIAAGPVFARHAKFSERDYDPERRLRDYEEVGEAYSNEIDLVEKWIRMVADHLGIGLRPGA